PAFEKNAELLKSLDTKLRRLDAQDELISGLDHYQQTAFNLLRSPKLRRALGLSREPAPSLERYRRHHTKTRYPSRAPLPFLLARRLVEVGVPIVHFNFGYWDWHGDNFTAGKQQIPMLDAALSALLDDLEVRGLLESTIVLALGEMGRKPKIDNPKAAGAGRDHWDYAQFVIAAGGGFTAGNVVGAAHRPGGRGGGQVFQNQSFRRAPVPLRRHHPPTPAGGCGRRRTGR